MKQNGENPHGHPMRERYPPRCESRKHAFPERQRRDNHTVCLCSAPDPRRSVRRPPACLRSCIHPSRTSGLCRGCRQAWPARFHRVCPGFSPRVAGRARSIPGLSVFLYGFCAFQRARPESGVEQSRSAGEPRKTPLCPACLRASPVCYDDGRERPDAPGKPPVL